MDVSTVALIITAFLVYILIGIGFYEAVTGGVMLVSRICARHLGLLSDPHISGPFVPFTFRINAGKASLSGRYIQRMAAREIPCNENNARPRISTTSG